MAYHDINRLRYKFLLTFGTDDEELRRFFSEKRFSLMKKGAKVQNMPHGPEARIATMLRLAAGTDPIVQEWFATNLNMIDPEPVDSLIDTFRLYEDEGESLPEGDAKRLSRSCLMHLFSSDPPPQLVSFLRSPLGGNGVEYGHDTEPDKEGAYYPIHKDATQTIVDSDFARALVALLENKDPDEYLSGTPSPIASLVSGLYAIKSGRDEDAINALNDLNEYEQVKAVLSEYSARLTKAKKTSKPISTGIQIVRFEEIENPVFDFDRDLIIGQCIKDYPETAVFIQPFAILTGDGRLVSLEKQATRERLLPYSGDVQAFAGRTYPKQPMRGEIGLWKIAPNETFSSASHRTKFHIVSAKTDVYEVRTVPFLSSDYDSVRGFIKEQITKSSKRQLEPLLFLLHDELVVGCPSGRDLTRVDGFDDGLPSWKALNAFRFEGRILVSGPLPAHEQYECATIASTLKRFFVSRSSSAENLTRAQQKHLLDRINSGEAHLSASRRTRLIAELECIEDDEEAAAILIAEAIKNEKIALKIDHAVQERIEDQIKEKSQIVMEIEQLKKQRTALKESIVKQEREQRALPSAVYKAIRETVRKAKEDAVETLSEVVMFRALMEEFGAPRNVSNESPEGQPPPELTIVGHDATPLLVTLRSLGISPKHARALEIASEAAFSTGMIFIIEGIAARLAALAWGRMNKSGCILMECGIGVTEDKLLRGISPDEARTFVLLDANLSPPDVYARPLIDRVHRMISDRHYSGTSNVVMSLSDGVAGLPLPTNVNAVAIRVSLDIKPSFLSTDEAAARLEELRTGDSDVQWSSRLWKPALSRLIEHMTGLPSEDLALGISVLIT